MKNFFKTLTLIFFLSFLFTFPCLSKAAEVELNIEREYVIDTRESISVIEKHTITNNSKDNLIDKNNTDRFQIVHLKSNKDSLSSSVETAKIMVDGREVDFNVEYEEEIAVITVDFPRGIARGGSMTFTLTYTNFGLIEQTGALIDIYASGLAIGADSNSVQDILFSTTIKIKKGVLPNINFVLPSPTDVDDDDGQYIYSFDKASLLGRSVWIQLGTKQYYKFKITQSVNPNSTISLPFEHEYRLILPRSIDNAEVNQKVYYEDILPLPSGIEQDEDGNIFAYFNLPGNEKGEITIQGYVEVGISDVKVDKNNSGDVADYDLGIVGKWLEPAPFWEVDSSKIQETALGIKGEETNVFELIKDTYDFVVEKIDYSQVKKFGINERIGALATLNNGSGVCMEYSDLFLSLMRAEGIPAQAVFGFGYDPLIDATEQEPHQWVQVYIPELDKWLDIDVTWGENGDAAVGGYLNHIYTHIASLSPEQHSEVVLTGFAIKDDDLELPGYDISAVSQVPEGEYMTQEELIAKYPFTPPNAVVSFITSLPKKIFELLSSFSEQEKIYIVIFTIGFSLILFPILYRNRRKIDFKVVGKKETTSALQP